MSNSSKSSKTKAATKLFIDMDGVTANFLGSHFFKSGQTPEYNPPEMFNEKFFETLPPVDGALEAVRMILKSDMYDVYILTKPVKCMHYSYGEKAAWIMKWLPEMRDRILMMQDKSLVSGSGRINIDDHERNKNPWIKAGGKFILFDLEIPSREMWRKVLQELRIIPPDKES